MIQRVSELDQYHLSTAEGSCFVRDYLDDNAKKNNGEDNPNYLHFKDKSFFDNLSSTMLFEVSLGRPMDEHGALDDSNQNEAISYYKSYKVGADVLGMLAMNTIRYYPMSFGDPGPEQDCSLSGHHKYPNPNTHYQVYGSMEFHAESIFHSYAYFHENIAVNLNLSVGQTLSTRHINIAGNVIAPGLHNEGDDWYFSNPIHGVAMSACWADLAECYKSDADYPVGTLVQFGGDEEITIAESEANAVITERPGFVLNSSDEDRMLGIALTGRTPVRVIGPVRKFDKLCFSGIRGLASRMSDTTAQRTIAIALEGNDSPDEKLVMCAVQLSL